jgi:hypothetical protein
METDQLNRIIAAILAAGLLRPHKDALSGAEVEPSCYSAVETYRQCLRTLRERQSQGSPDY